MKPVNALFVLLFLSVPVGAELKPPCEGSHTPDCAMVGELESQEPKLDHVYTSTRTFPSRLIKWEPKIEWLGNIVFDNGKDAPAWSENIEIGLREDGVVCWRKKEKK